MQLIFRKYFRANSLSITLTSVPVSGTKISDIFYNKNHFRSA